MKPTPLPGRTKTADAAPALWPRRGLGARHPGGAAGRALPRPADHADPAAVPARAGARRGAVGSLAAESQLELGDMALALEGGTWPVFRFAPVVYTDLKSGAKIRMEALEVGFSPVRALWGQPGATVTMVGAAHPGHPGPLRAARRRASRSSTIPAAARPTVRVLEGRDAFPQIGIRSGGIEVEGAAARGIDRQHAVGQRLAGLQPRGGRAGHGRRSSSRPRPGRFSRLIIRDGVARHERRALRRLPHLQRHQRRHDARAPTARSTKGTFSAELRRHGHAGQRRAAWSTADGTARLRSGVTNLDFALRSCPSSTTRRRSSASSAPARSRSTSASTAETGKLVDGQFHIDMTGMDLRVQDDLFPIAIEHHPASTGSRPRRTSRWPRRASASATPAPRRAASSRWGSTRTGARPSACR